jgi:lipopolysaccharide export LptBFGC system permease protein LptF
MFRRALAHSEEIGSGGARPRLLLFMWCRWSQGYTAAAAAVLAAVLAAVVQPAAVKAHLLLLVVSAVFCYVSVSCFDGLGP